MLASCRTAFAAHWLGEEIERLEEVRERGCGAYLLVGYYEWPQIFTLRFQSKKGLQCVSEIQRASEGLYALDASTLHPCAHGPWRCWPRLEQNTVCHVMIMMAA